MLTTKSKLDSGVLPFQPQRLISFWDMIQFCAIDAASKLAWVDAWRNELDGQILKNGIGGRPGSGMILDMIKDLSSIRDFCVTFELNNSESRVGNFLWELSNSQINNGAILQELRGLHPSMKDELCNRYCAVIPNSKLDFFEKERLFGDEVWTVFPEIRNEIKDAGNCIAADLNTAAIFHLMRIAEFGLKKLSRPFNLKLNDPVTQATWGNILRQMEAELQRKGVKRTKARQQKMDNYSKLLLEISAFKHLWRDPVSHFKGRYNFDEAKAAFWHVRAYMINLSTKI